MILHASRKRLIQNTTALFGAQGVSMLVPLLTFPYLARVLRPEGWAVVLVAQALGNWLILLLEFGFDLSGTRAVAHARSVPDSLPGVVAGIQGAKLLLVPLAALILGGVFLALPTLRGSGTLLLWTLAFAIARGLNPLWFFQGIERVHWAAIAETVSKACAALGVFLLVRGPSDGWIVLALQAVFAVLSLVVLTAGMARTVPLVAPTRSGVLSTLRAAFRIFGVRAASGMYIQANALILAALTGAATVAFFGGAERIIRASINLLQPLTQTFLPRVSYLSVTNPRRGIHVIEICLLAIGAVGAAFGLCAFFGAPLLVRVLLGPGYAPATPVLRALSPLPLLVAVDTVLGLYWAVPFGHERGFLRAVLMAGVVNVTLALALVPRWGALGMASAVVAAELTVTVCLATLFVRYRLEPEAVRDVVLS
jgi:PST family polysaccharide transporter